MEKKDTLSSCSESEEQQMQLIQDKSKESCMVSFQRLHSHLKRLSNNDLKGSRTENGFGRAFATLFGQDFETFTGTMFLNMDQLQKQLDNNEFQEIGSMASFKVLETQLQMFINSHIYLNDEYIVMTRNYFLEYTRFDILEFHDTLIQHMESVKKSIDERAKHKEEYNSWVNERQIQTTEEKIDTSNASSVIIESNGTESQKQDTRSRSWNDANIRPIYDEELIAEVQMTADDNVSTTGQQLTKQPESNNEGEVDQNVDQCYDTRPLPTKLTDNRTTELSNQLLESKNVWQQSQFSKVKSNEAMVKHDIDVIETINIKLEHKVAKLLNENETLKRHYKEMFDSIKTTRAKNIEHTTSLIANNDKFKAQLQEKGFAIAALKNELRKLTGNIVNTKFAKSSILGKPVLQPYRNQSVVRQPTAFKSERPKISKQQFASQVDVNNDLWQPTGRILKTVWLRWVPTGKIFTSSTTKVNSEPPNGSKEDITNQCESKQALDVNAGTLLSTGVCIMKCPGLALKALKNEKENVGNKGVNKEAFTQLQTKQLYGKALTKLVKKVKKLEDQFKSFKEKRKTKVVISDEEEDLVSKDSSKQERKNETEHEGVQMDEFTPTKVTQGEEPSQESSEVQLDVLSASKILAEASRERDTKVEKTKSKRVAEETLLQESFKKLRAKTSRLDYIQEQHVEEPKELTEEELKGMMVIIPKEGIHFEALQTKYLIIDWELSSECTMKKWKIIRVEDHEKLWSLVSEKFNTTQPTNNKEKELWVELKRLFKPDKEDTLWKIHRERTLYLHAGREGLSTDKRSYDSDVE
ncbi:hypothetical protein Tco_0752753 [Tanacetum coccineum]|uniref:Uncharacterized protein n=1 Tax=Tanacetum coccineum TaxID=301880 RepID=A0ABQ4ZAL7_9ASTR